MGGEACDVEGVRWGRFEKSMLEAEQAALRVIEVKDEFMDLIG